MYARPTKFTARPKILNAKKVKRTVLVTCSCLYMDSCIYRWSKRWSWHEYGILRPHANSTTVLRVCLEQVRRAESPPGRAVDFSWMVRWEGEHHRLALPISTDRYSGRAEFEGVWHPEKGRQGLLSSFRVTAWVLTSPVSTNMVSLMV